MDVVNIIIGVHANRDEKSETIAKIQQLSRAAMDALNKCETQEDTIRHVRMDVAEACKTCRPRAW